MLIKTNWERQYLTGLLHKMKSYFVKNTISNTVNLDIVQLTQLNLRKITRPALYFPFQDFTYQILVSNHFISKIATQDT